MKSLNVECVICDRDYNRLLKITEAYRKQGLDFSLEEQFELIMFDRAEVDRRLSYHEKILGLKKEPER